MTSNPSVRQFKTDMQDLVNQVGHNFQEQLNRSADELISNMRQVVRVDKGDLSRSIRKKDVSKGINMSVLVMAGGRATTKRGRNGQMYDHALSEEFGTQKEVPSPFFYNTYRLYQHEGLEQYKETLEETIKENNIVRGLRSQNYNNAAGTRAVGHRGAVVIQRK